MRCLIVAGYVLLQKWDVFGSELSFQGAVVGRGTSFVHYMRVRMSEITHEMYNMTAQNKLHPSKCP